MQSRMTTDLALQALLASVWRRKHTNNGMPSPVDYETEQKKMNDAGV